MLPHENIVGGGKPNCSTLRDVVTTVIKYRFGTAAVAGTPAASRHWPADRLAR